MPTTKKQKGAACAELSRRRKGGKKSSKGKGFRSASKAVVEDFCTSPIKK